MPQSLCSLLVRVVFSTKDRAKDLDADLRPRLFGYIATVIDSKGAKAHIVGGGLEHVHVLLTWPASVTLADMVRLVKSKFVAMGPRNVSQETPFWLASRLRRLQR